MPPVTGHPPATEASEGPRRHPADPRDDTSAAAVEHALRQITPAPERPRAPIATRHKLRIGTYALVFVATTALFYALRLDAFTFAAPYLPLLQRLARGAMFVALVLLAGSVARAYIGVALDDEIARYNVRRILRFAEGVVITFIAISVVFVNWYTAAVSLGVVSAILGFALQTPLSSFIGWMYILVRQPYRVGDRIQIGDATGDVIDVGYLDTTLWEFGGPYVSTDHPSGRLIKFPNANVLAQAVYNYSWPLFPYIWNEITVQVAYGSDLRFVADTMRHLVEDELGDTMRTRVETYRRLLARTPIGELQVQSRPVVIVRVSENTWIEPTVRYLVSPRQAGAVKSTLTAKILAALGSAPDKVMFPKGDSR